MKCEEVAPFRVTLLWSETSKKQLCANKSDIYLYTNKILSRVKSEASRKNWRSPQKMLDCNANSELESQNFHLYTSEH
jgi:hypothetical protein